MNPLYLCSLPLSKIFQLYCSSQFILVTPPKKKTHKQILHVSHNVIVTVPHLKLNVSGDSH